MKTSSDGLTEEKIHSAFEGVKWSGFFLAIIGTGFSISFCGIGLGVYLGGLLLQRFADKRYHARSFPKPKLLSLLVASLCVSFVLSPLPYESARGLFKFIQGFIFLYAGCDLIRSKTHLYRTLAVFGAVFLVAAADGVYQSIFSKDFIHGKVVWKEHLGRLTGPFKQPTDFGVFLAGAIALCVGVTAEFVHRRRILWTTALLILTMMLCFSLFKTYARGSLFALTGALTLMALFYRWRFWAVGAIAVALCVLILVPSPWSTRLKETFTLNRGSTAERIMILETTTKMIQDKPFFGKGLNTYNHFFPQYRPENYPGTIYAHNGYMQIAAEAGLIGVTIYLIFLGSLMVSVCRAAVHGSTYFDRNILLGLLAAIAAILANALFESVFQSTQLRTLLWLLIGVALAGTYQDKR